MLTGFTCGFLLNKVKEAVPNVTDCIFEFTDFEKALPNEEVSLWKTQVEAWEEDADVPNPVETRVKCMGFD